MVNSSADQANFASIDQHLTRIKANVIFAAYGYNESFKGKEGLEKFKGPQLYIDKEDRTLLHYYGKGWYQWYKKSVFEKEMEKIFGD